MSKVISHKELSPTLALTECADGFWLYDKTRSMNLSMKAKSETAAFVEALSYYQKRLKEVEKAHSDLSNRVETFVSQFADNSDLDM